MVKLCGCDLGLLGGEEFERVNTLRRHKDGKL